MPSWPSSLRARLTLWYTALLGLPLIAFAVVCYLVVADSLIRRTDRFIGDALTAFAGELTAERRTSLSAREAMRSTIEEVRFRDLHVAILDPAGVPVAATAAPDSGLTQALAAAGADTVALTVAGPAGPRRIVIRPFTADGERFRLTGVYGLADMEEILARIRALFLVAIPVLVACAALGGLLLARRSLAPLATMSSQAARISASNLDQRLPVAGGDELAGLGRVVNGLLDRLEAAFAQQRRFVADASHELRTPTAILRTEADVTLARDHRPEGEYRASVTVMRDAARRLARIVEELFLLARADAGHLVAAAEPLYLEDVVHDVVRSVQAVAEQRGVRLTLGDLTEAPLVGDADLLGRLLLNLLDNAIKYAPPGGQVSVTMTRRDGSCQVEVTDDGPGIPVEAREKVFERFYRIDAARSRSESGTTSGAGLGLPIARRIAEMHAGRLTMAESAPGRTVFRLTLPLAPAASSSG